ncbi:MAG: phosphatidate cytidylyltransferase [Clostridiaceae bacterium]|mgnify:CR=1 FL=1|nr:phosphatidate cytidylyltransferase [Clostridiaceae bacterium]
MKTRVTTAIIFGLIMGIFIIPGYFSVHFTLPLLIIIGVLASGEFSNALRKIDLNFNRINLMLYNLAFLPSFFYILLSGNKVYSPQLVRSLAIGVSSEILLDIDGILLGKLLIIYTVVILTLSLYSLFKPLFLQGANGLRQGVLNIAAGLYVSLPLFAGFLLLYALPIGWYLFVLAITTPWVCDTAALYCGMLWGKKKLAPLISPNKTLVGFYGGIVGTIIMYILLLVFLVPNLLGIEYNLATLIFVTVIAVIIAILTQIGDLLASAIKRICGIKDFSNLMPGHGGIMDRFDSTYFTFISILTIALLVYFF